MLSFIRSLLEGMVGVLTYQVSALYRYPYRNSAEAFRGDWLKLGRDIENALDKEEAE